MASQYWSHSIALYLRIKHKPTAKQQTIFWLIEVLYLQHSNYKMKREPDAASNHNFLVRWLHLHSLNFTIRLGSSKQDSQQAFPTPQFQLFRPIPRYYQGENDRFKLFKNLLLAFRWEISVGILLTVIFASLNLLLSQIIKSFMEVMQLSESERLNSYVTEKFVVLQLLRMIFGVHMKRAFQQIAIMAESTIAKKLVKKALLMDAQCRKRIPDTEIFQLQNVDLKLIHSLFSNLYLGVEIPFTIGIAIIWLFAINTFLGVIALYWFLIIFFLQRALDQRMRRCNLTKLKLIDQRSKLNYQFMEKVTLARIIKHESMLVEKNNDFFLEENHDHSQFYRYSSLYDIAQLLLPIAVVVTSLVFDQSNTQPMTVEQLYLILSMLGICYRPMKDFRTFSISLSDGLHSLRRLTDYLELPEEEKKNVHYKHISLQPAEIAIAKGTIGRAEGRGIDIEFEVRHQIQLVRGERLAILGRKGQGSSLFLNMLVGQIPLKQGLLRIQGKIAYLSQQNFFLIDTLANNLSFYNQSCTRFEIHKIYEQLGLIDELSLSKGLDEIVELNKYNENQLKLISIARVLCSQADIYILDSPFNGLNIDSALKVEKLLRQRQEDGKIIIMTLKKIQSINDNDKIIILHLAATKEYGKYKDLIKNQRSYIDHFLKKSSSDLEDIDQTTFRLIAHEFQSKVRKALTYGALFQKESDKKMKKEKIQSIVKCLTTFSAGLLREAEQKKKKAEEMKHEQSLGAYFLKFLRCCKLSESSYILIIIIAVEVLHIFIHFFIGHEYEHRAKEGIKSLRTLMFYEVVLTIGLAGLIYLEGEVSTHLAIITGNKLYKLSLQSLVHKELRWYGEEYSLRTADKFNHDYEQIFIAVHGVLTVYKNVIILLATALFISGNHPMVLVGTAVVAGLYFFILTLLRRAHSKILKHYYDYKYEFVKVFNESIEGAQLIKIYGVGRELVRKAKKKYSNLASYKLASNYIFYGQSVICDLASTFITAFALQFGTSVKMNKKSDIAILATSILLLLNLADVLKSILDAAINVQTFFRINIHPFMEIAPSDRNDYPRAKPLPPPQKFDISFNNVLLKQQDEQVFEIYPLKLEISEGEIVCICEEDETLRDNLLYGLTKNLSHLTDLDFRTNTIFFGGIPICDFNSESLKAMVGVIMNENFFLSGTLKENLSWRTPDFNEELVLKIAKELGMNEDLKRFDKQGLNANIQEIDEDLGTGLGKKIAVLRVLISKPRIVIIKDTPPFVGRWSIVQLLNKYNPGCTIIKITNSLDVAYDVNRIVLLDKLRFFQEGNPKKLQYDKLSKLGEMLRSCNEEAYIYRNRVSVMPHYKKDLQKVSKLFHTKKK